MKNKIVVSFLIISIFNKIKSFDIRDCSYDEANYHVEYICEGAFGPQYESRTNQYLYCNNYIPGIDRAKVLKLTFRGCQSYEFSEYFFLSSFKTVRSFNVSSAGLKRLKENMFKSNKYLEQFVASHNHLTEIPGQFFSYTTELILLDLSHNQIRKLDSFVFDKTYRLKTIQLSFNSIEKIYKRLFANLPELENVDFSNNQIAYIESDLLNYNTKLKQFNLNNNQVVRLSCEFLSSLTSLNSLVISLNTLEEFDFNCSNGKIHGEYNVNISSSKLATTLEVSDNRLEWIITEVDFLKLRYLRLSNSQMSNISSILQETSTQIEGLDLSNTFIGELNESTFQRFVNLKKLNLSRTNLSNFEFSTFYHQRNLEELDISYNNLNKVDFFLFLRNFQNLTLLNLEGNNLTEIDSINRTHFPKLSILGISKNNFSCDYLVKFLLQWPDLKLIDNPSNQTHIGGVDCLHRSSNGTVEMVPLSATMSQLVHRDEGSLGQPNHQKELFIIQILLGLIILLILLSFVTKKWKHSLESIKERLMKSSDSQYVSYNPRNSVQIQQDLLIPQSFEQNVKY